MHHDQSHAIFHRAERLLPGRVNSSAQVLGGVGGDPVGSRVGRAYLFDVDGNR